MVLVSPPSKYSWLPLVIFNIACTAKSPLETKVTHSWVDSDFVTVK